MQELAHTFSRILIYGCFASVLGAALPWAAPAQGAQPYVPQPVDPLTEAWRWRSFPALKDQGLQCLEEGPDGTMWFGVDGGAVRYDGLAWTRFRNTEGLPHTVIGFAQSGQRIYATTRNGVYVFGDDRWNPVFQSNTDWPWVFESISAAADGGLWAATCWGALRLHGIDGRPPVADGVTTTLYTTDDVAKAFVQNAALPAVKFVIVETPVRKRSDETGMLLFSNSWNAQLVIGLVPDGPAALAGLRIGDLILGVNGGSRLAAISRGLNAAPGAVLKLEIARPGIASPFTVDVTCAEGGAQIGIFRPFRIIEDNSGTVWFATRQGRVIALSRSSDGAMAWENHTRRYKLAKMPFPSIAVTRRGIAVVGRENNERRILQYDGSQWTSATVNRPSHWSILAAPNDRLLVGANGRIISVGPDDAFTIRTKDFGIYGSDILLSQSSDHAIWVAGINSIAIRIEPQGGRWTSYEGLNFQALASDGTEWFLTSKKSIVSRAGNTWLEYDHGDGLMTAPMSVLTTTAGDVWVAGSHDGVAATARFHNGGWQRELHPKLSWNIDRRTAFEDRQGRVWFGASWPPPGKEFQGGVIRFDGQQWKHLPIDAPLGYAHAICQTPDGSVWMAGKSLFQILPDDSIREHNRPPDTQHMRIESIAGDDRGDLWVAMAQGGVSKLLLAEQESGTTSTPAASVRSAQSVADDSPWQDMSFGLSSKQVTNLVGLPGGAMLASTNEDFDYYDGKKWHSTALPKELAFDIDSGGLRPARDQAIWVNLAPPEAFERVPTVEEAPVDSGLFKTMRYLRDSSPPVTRLVDAATRIQAGENSMVSWSGIDRWNTTPPFELRFSWRIDEESWSPFSSARSASLLGVSAGKHRFQVRARDTDFNTEATPIAYHFEVIPPVWRRNWFRSLILLAGILAVSALLQTLRVFRHEASLRVANTRLLTAEQQLQSANADLEKRVERRTVELQAVNQRLQSEVDERTMAEARLHESEVRYRSIVEDQTEFIVRCDPNGKIEFANRALLRANGLLPNADDGSGTLSALPESCRGPLQKRIASLIPELIACPTVLRVARPGGEVRWEEWSGRETVDGDGHLLGYQLIGRDITELRGAQARLDEKEQQLAHLARVSALGEMVAEISHEINQPLSCIANFSAASLHVLDQNSDFQKHSEDLREWVAQISEQVQRISGIVRSLRRFGRPGSNHETFQISEAINEAIMVMESRTRHTVEEIEVDCPTTLSQITADRIQIEQVLVNLIRNACDAMEHVPSEDRRLRIEATERDGAVVVAVIDAGPGIPPNLAKSVFNAFVTTKASGMGIGLAISRSILEAHDGTIRAVTDGGCGRVEFSLPLHQTAAHVH